jgi:hypothetical protein
MQLPCDVSMQLWENKLFACSAPHIKEIPTSPRCTQISNPHITVHYTTITSSTGQSTHFHGKQPVEFMCIIGHTTTGTKSRFHTLDCGFLNQLYYHTTKMRNVYKYNSVRSWVKDINLLDYDYMCIPTNNNQLCWMLFIILPAERRVE